MKDLLFFDTCTDPHVNRSFSETRVRQKYLHLYTGEQLEIIAGDCGHAFLSLAALRPLPENNLIYEREKKKKKKFIFNQNSINYIWVKFSLILGKFS